MDRIKVLAVAPYPGLATVLEGVTPDYPDIDLTIHVGDLESGLAVAHTSFSQNFDAVISRGGTAQILEEELSVPVVEIELSTGDVLRQTRGIPTEGPRLAAVGFGNTFTKLVRASDLLPRPIDVRTVDFADEVPIALDELAASGHETFLCDNFSYESARERGLDARLLVSGPESVRQALDRVRFYFSQCARARRKVACSGRSSRASPATSCCATRAASSSTRTSPRTRGGCSKKSAAASPKVRSARCSSARIASGA